MKTLLLKSSEIDFGFGDAKRAADAVAHAIIGDHVCMSWYNRARDQESPAHVSECHEDGCEIPGYIDYATARGAVLRVDVGEGAFVFCYRPLGEFAPEE